MQSPLRQHLITSLYHEVVLDGPRNQDKQGVTNILAVIEWRVNNTITDSEFHHLLESWHVPKSANDNVNNNNIIITKKWMADTLLVQKPDIILLSMLGLLVREDNYNKLKAGHTPEWCKAIEQLFWILDDGGRGYATQDDLLFLLLAILGNPVVDLEGQGLHTSGCGQHRVTVAAVLQHTSNLMKEFNQKEGLVTLKHFKDYFHVNRLDLEAIQRSITLMIRLLNNVQMKTANNHHHDGTGCDSGEDGYGGDEDNRKVQVVLGGWHNYFCVHMNFCFNTIFFMIMQESNHQPTVPKVWEKAIYQAIDYVHNSLNQFEDVNAWGVVDFLMTDAFEVRFGVTSEKPHWKLSLQLFKSFTKIYGYVSPIEYTKDSIFRDQNFMLIQQTLRFYDELLSEILDDLFPCEHLSTTTENEDIIRQEKQYHNNNNTTNNNNNYMYTNNNNKSVTEPPAKVALGEYTAPQVTEWLSMATWIDVSMVGEEDSHFLPTNDDHDQHGGPNFMIDYSHSSSGNAVYPPNITNSNDHFDRDNMTNNYNNNNMQNDLKIKRQGMDGSQIYTHPNSQQIMEPQPGKQNQFKSMMAVENITPTYLHSIFTQAPTQHLSKPKKSTTTNQVQPKLKSTAPPPHSHLGDSSDNIVPIGVVPISKIPHKETIKKLQNPRK